MVSNAANKSRRTKAVGSPGARERWTSFLLTIKLFQWNVLAYKLIDVDCPVCYY